MKSAFSLLVLAALAGCAGPETAWTSPQAGEDRRTRDYLSCRRLAEMQSGVDTRRLDEPKPGDPFREYDRGRAAPLSSALLAQCMEDKGYARRRSS